MTPGIVHTMSGVGEWARHSSGQKSAAARALIHDQLRHRGRGEDPRALSEAAALLGPWCQFPCCPSAGWQIAPFALDGDDYFSASGPSGTKWCSGEAPCGCSAPVSR